MSSEKNRTTEPVAEEECPMCLAGTLREGSTTITLERGEATVVLKEVPANVCDVCGEAYVDEEVSAAVYEKAEEAVEADVQFDVRRWKGVRKATT
ncbi:type II toxin-antitoxin system MqsA family antitoxin [Salinibacter grassmerensis]|uniref:type II toxin-antitoxin system MqsA family antitoxin n=1 Tax=Salinibacter grassmerensis TaxID=3040353 RepID=UPI0021E828AD|nr:type II toxin-antitoxin system MqsA family antitoxin [Salinibacter grassmerensis]